MERKYTTSQKGHYKREIDMKESRFQLTLSHVLFQSLREAGGALVVQMMLWRATLTSNMRISSTLQVSAVPCRAHFREYSTPDLQTKRAERVE